MENKINEGTRYEYEFSFTQEDVMNFANASGDNNPIHLDDDYAATTIFGKRIIHGFLGASIFSKVFGTLFPGNGTIYLKQDLVFMKPMFIHTKYMAKFLVLSIDKNKNRATVQTEITEESGLSVINGQALIKHHEIK